MTLLPEIVLAWYDANARDLPWRSAPDPWGVLVSEVMLQQTPVARVLPVYAAWLGRWPTPRDLAAADRGDAVRAWGRLGYPRRALRLHEAATVITDRHGGVVPADVDELLALPGVGAYTARAVATFAYGQRHPVVDINVRRVLARAVDGLAQAGPPRTSADLAAAQRWLPDDEAVAARFAAALMEIGALVCTARRPDCARCPLVDTCAWVRAGRPEHAGPPPRRQEWHGSDRQARGALLAVLRDAVDPVDVGVLAAAWPEPEQRTRALAGLVADGLAELVAPAGYRLPRTAGSSVEVAR